MRSAHRWRTLISAAILISEQPGQRGLQECWGSARSWCTSISVGQRVLQECWRSALPWLNSISATIGSAMLGQKSRRSACAVRSPDSPHTLLVYEALSYYLGNQQTKLTPAQLYSAYFRSGDLGNAALRKPQRWHPSACAVHCPDSPDSPQKVFFKT